MSTPVNPRELASSFSRDVAWNLTARVLSTLLGLAAAVLGARLLGPAGWGVYAVAVALTTLVAQFANLGLHSANTYHVSRDPALGPALLANSLVLSAAGAGLGALLMVAGLLAPGLFPVSGEILVLALAAVPFLLMTVLVRALLLGLGRVRAYNVAEVLPAAVVLAGLAILALRGTVAPRALVALALAGTAAGALFSVTAVRLQLRGAVRASATLLRSTLGFGIRAYLAAFFAFALLRIDLLMVKGISGAGSAGLYAAATSLADGLYLVPTAVGAILFPRLVRLPPLERWRVTRRLTWGVAGLLVLAAAVAGVLARPVLVLVYGRAFAAAAPAFRVLALAMVFYGANNVVSNHLAAAGFPPLAVWVWLAAALGNVLLNLVLIPRQGLFGAALASLVCYAGVLVAQYVYARNAAHDHAR